MKVTPVFKFVLTRYGLPAIVLSAAMFSPALVSTAFGQQQLSLGDILIALRSKKVTLDERNKILADAVKSRGITFALTPEIEKELGGGGADSSLIAAVRDKTPAPVAVKKIEPAFPPVVATPAPPDHAFYMKRADGLLAKGELDNAVADYGKAIEMKPTDEWGYFNRGGVHFTKKDYASSAADFSKVIEINPQSAAAFVNRGKAREGMGDTAKAMADYKKASELDGNNDAAKFNMQRLQADLTAKANPPKVDPPKADPVVAKKDPLESILPTVTTPKVEGPVQVGSLRDYATRLAMPTYSAIDRQRNVQGIVVVVVDLNEEGNVVSAKASSGPPSLRAAAEEAVKRSRFKPVERNNKAIKATGFISFNFAGN